MSKTASHLDVLHISFTKETKHQPTFLSSRCVYLLIFQDRIPNLFYPWLLPPLPSSSPSSSCSPPAFSPSPFPTPLPPPPKLSSIAETLIVHRSSAATTTASVSTMVAAPAFSRPAVQAVQRQENIAPSELPLSPARVPNLVKHHQTLTTAVTTVMEEVA